MGTVVRRNVTKSNDLVIAAYKLTLNEQRLLLAAIAQIDPRKPLPRPITISAHDFADQYQIPVKQAYEALKEASNALYERDIKTFDGRYKSRFRWVDRVDYLDGGGETKLFFTVHVQPYLVHLNKRFTTYDLKRVADLSSTHSIRIFELLQQFRKTGFYTVSVADFREYLELGPSYERYSNLKGKVIDPALKELREKSGLEIELETERKGRAIDRLKFTFKDQEQMRLDFSATPELELALAETD
ncbi:TPA: replication initiation protein [Pseudomonas aeruginosa]|uniref:replication initiation protein n=1 Tax=Pseudomonas aeruginosa TaxID=287 RepID=UPI0022CDDC70|nr:replication initiation protein [Pseudomonas aeruginosa]MBX6583433.1 replication initiation protein [Pseudomonas aeruginosa]MBX6631792.1 replication initiation protein [Pseudomonas aeruginosa]MCZ9831444.1 replication initiation protein [Pseudomonas aeruginosa]HBO2152791.1 replication initiation protein [Pseudomonas aeruginosa]HCI2696250.1 replication initiation protein [Pseudomonas aeruginosa]